MGIHIVMEPIGQEREEGNLRRTSGSSEKEVPLREDYVPGPGGEKSVDGLLYREGKGRKRSTSTHAGERLVSLKENLVNTGGRRFQGAIGECSYPKEKEGRDITFSKKE